MTTNIPNIYGANDNEWNVGPTGPAGVGGAIGSTYYNTTTGNLSVYATTGNWVTAGSSLPAYVNTGIYTINATSSVYSNGVDYSTNDIILKRNGKDDLHVGKAIDAMMERLCIIEPAFELLEKYPALREAYNNYKLIETMVKNGNHDDEQ